MNTNPLVRQIKQQAIRALDQPKVDTVKQLETVLKKVLASLQEIERTRAQLEERINALGDKDTGDTHTKIIFDESGLLKQKEGDKGSEWTIRVTIPEIKHTLPLFGSPGDRVRVRDVAKKSGLVRRKAYVLLNALENIGAIEYSGQWEYTRTGLTQDVIWDKLRKLK